MPDESNAFFKGSAGEFELPTTQARPALSTATASNVSMPVPLMRSA